MTTQIHEIPTEDVWHELRSRHVGASESEALLGVCKYNTPFSLYHHKRGSLPKPELDDERVFWGTHMEATIAMGLAKRHALRVRKAKHYLTNDAIPGAGASLDYTIDAGDDGQVPFEIKNVDTFVFMEEWEKRDGVVVPPVHIDIQVQQQMMVSGAPYGYLGVLIGGNDAHLIKCPPHEKMQRVLRDSISAFWDMVANDVEPATDAGDLAAAQYAWLVPERKKILDLTGHKDLDLAASSELQKYARGALLVTQGESMKDEAKLRLLGMAKSADKLLCSAGSFNSEQKAGYTQEERVTPAKEVKPRRNALAYPSKKTKDAAAAS